MKLLNSSKIKTTKDIKKIKFQNFKKNNENLIIYPNSKSEIPFNIKRVFIISDVRKFSPRGSHSHKNTQQVFVALKGKISFLFFDGINKKKISLNRPTIGIYVPKGIWYETHYENNNSSLVVFSDKLYKESDYIRDKVEYIKYRNVQNS